MRQPKALIPLFLTELWERFGFYIVQGLLVLYLTNYLNFSDSRSYALLGEYSALIYLSPIIGGFIADRFLGFRYSILLGGLLLSSGYAILATMNTNLLFLGLGVIILGNGFLKSNISSYLGEFYDHNDARREAGFTIFYMGINIGAMLSTLCSGFIQQSFGWRITFTCASIGMLIGVITYVLGMKSYEDKGLPKTKTEITPRWLRRFHHPLNLVWIVTLIVSVSYLLLKHTGLGSIILSVIGIGLLIALLCRAFHYENVTRNRMFALVILIMISIVFWGIWFQLFSAINLFVERSVDRIIFGINVPPVAFLSLEAIFIILLGAPFAILWKKLHKKNINPSVGYKFAMSLLVISIAMWVLVLAIPKTSELISPTWLILFYLLVTVSELLLSPIGLATITQLAPRDLVGMMMGVWFMSLGFGGMLTGLLAQIATLPSKEMSLLAQDLIYKHAFTIYAVVALITGLAALMIAPWLKKLTRPLA